MTRLRLSLPSPSMLVALLALTIAVGGVSVAAIPGPDGAVHACVASGGQIGVGSPLTPYAVPQGNLRVIDSDASCGSGETPLVIDAPQNPVSEDPPVVFASRSAKGKRMRGKRTEITSNAVAEGQYLVSGAVRVSHPGGLEQDQRVRCSLLGPDGKVLPASTVGATFEKGADAGDVTIPISTVIDHVAAGEITLACEEDAIPGGDGATSRAARAASSAAQGAAVNSPGIVSGNLTQVPVHVPVNACGNTINIVGLLDPTSGNTCVNP